MRLSYIFLVAAVMVASTLETTSAASGVTLSTSNTVLANANGNTGHDQRFLRQRQIPDDEEEEDDDTDDDVDSQEERGFLDSIKAGKVVTQLMAARNADDMKEIVSKIESAGVLETLLSRGMSTVKGKFPEFSPTMSFDDFMTMLGRAKASGKLTDDEYELMLIGFTKHLALKAA